MIEQRADFPDNVAAFACHGHVTKADYESVLIPDLNKRLESHDKVRIYYETAPDFDGFDPGAMWDDTRVGFRHFLRWERFDPTIDEDVLCLKFVVGIEAVVAHNPSMSLHPETSQHDYPR